MPSHRTSPSPLPALAALFLAALAAAGCQKGSQPAPEAGAPSATTATQPAAAASAPAPLPKVQTCQLLSAAEVSAVMGKALVQDGCSYGLDPAAQQKAMAAGQDQMAKASQKAQGGDLGAFAQGMMNSQKTMGNAIGTQLEVNVDARRDGQTEDEAKAIYAQTGSTVRGAAAPLQPEQRGLNGLIQGLDEVSGVGDWAFATNVASVSMGMGFSVRGRILEARKGPWRVTVSATVAPDPGAEALDKQLAGVARALIAKLPAA